MARTLRAASWPLSHGSAGCRVLPRPCYFDALLFVLQEMAEARGDHDGGQGFFEGVLGSKRGPDDATSASSFTARRLNEWFELQGPFKS